MGDTRIFQLGGSMEAVRRAWGQKIVIGLSTEENWQQVLWPLTTGNKKINVDYAVLWHILLIFT